MEHFLLKLCVNLMVNADPLHNLQRETQTKAVIWVNWRWRNYFAYLLNLHGVNYVRHTEIHTAGLLVSEQRAFEFEFAIEDIKSHKSPDIFQTPAELITAGAENFPTKFTILLFLFGIGRIA